MVDLILTEKPFAKVVHVVTSKEKPSESTLLMTLGRTATVLSARGLYFGDKRKLLMIVVDSSQISRLRDIVHLHDRDTFMIVTDAREILGKEF